MTLGQMAGFEGVKVKQEKSFHFCCCSFGAFNFIKCAKKHLPKSILKFFNEIKVTSNKFVILERDDNIKTDKR